MAVAPFPRPWTPRPVMSAMLDRAQRRIDARERCRNEDARLKGPNVFPVEFDGSQPEVAMPAQPEPIVNPWPSVRAIRRARGMSPDYDCGFPHDLGCETQLYLGLAIRSERPSIGIVALAEQCLVPVTEAAFFGRLLDIAEHSEWANENPHVIAAAIVAMRGQG